jgi:hypothetical protein
MEGRRLNIMMGAKEENPQPWEVAVAYPQEAVVHCEMDMEGADGVQIPSVPWVNKPREAARTRQTWDMTGV